MLFKYCRTTSLLLPGKTAESLLKTVEGWDSRFLQSKIKAHFLKPARHKTNFFEARNLKSLKNSINTNEKLLHHFARVKGETIDQVILIPDQS